MFVSAISALVGVSIAGPEAVIGMVLVGRGAGLEPWQHELEKQLVIF